MTHKFIVAPILVAFSLFMACTKLTPGHDPDIIVCPANGNDSSACTLTRVNYEYVPNMPYFREPTILTYDNFGRITSTLNSYGNILFTYTYESGKIIRRNYEGSTPIDSNMRERSVYILDNNNNVTYHTRAFYYKPQSDDDYITKDSMTYEYNTDGYLTAQHLYQWSFFLQQEYFYAYQDSNLVKKVHLYYTWGQTGPTGADTLNFFYNNTLRYAEADFLYELGAVDGSEVRTGKPSKNNVDSIACKMYIDYPDLPKYTSIKYTYITTGVKLRNALLHGKTTLGNDIEANIDFIYQCDGTIYK